MSEQSTRKKLVSYSDDDDVDKRSRSQVRRKSNKEVVSEDDTGSGNSFINDEAEEDEADSGSEAVESDAGFLMLKNSTPPHRGRRQARYIRDSDDDEESVPKARNFQVDDPASPKKKRVIPTTKNDHRPRNLTDDEDDNDDNVQHASPKKKGSKDLTVKTGSCRRQETSDDDEDEEQPLNSKKKTGIENQKTVVKAASAKKMVKVEVLTDSDIEIVEAPKTATKAKGGKPVQKSETPGKSPVKTPRKKAAPKSNAVVDDSDEDDAVTASKLAKGDTMYPEKRPSKVQPGNLKRSLPITPPYQTRAASAVVEQATPSKKPRKDKDNHDAPELSAGDAKVRDGPAKKASSSSTKTKGNVEDEDDDIPGLITREDSDDEENDDDNVFVATQSSKNAMFGKFSTPKKEAPVVLNQKYSDRRWSALPRPAECEVYDENLLDSSLKRDQSYEGLVPLRFCDIQNSGAPYTGAPGGTIVWSAWNQVFPTRKVERLTPLLEFKLDGRFVNLSRADPSMLAGRYMSDTQHELTLDNKTAICISLGSVRESALRMSASFGGPFISCGVRMVMHSLEFERWGATIGEIARRSLLRTQVWNSAVTFGTRLIRREDAPSSTKPKSSRLPAGFFNSYQSPKKKASGSSVSLPNFVGQLEITDEIPVYDARRIGKGFEWKAAVFESPADYFHEFDLFNNGGEIPSNALCAVGYVTQIYRLPADRDSSGKGKGKGKAVDEEPEDLRIAPLIQWVLVLGTL